MKYIFFLFVFVFNPSHFFEKPFCLEHQGLSQTINLELTQPNYVCHVGQGSSTKDYFLHRTMQSLERYFYLIVFNAFLHEQVTRQGEKPQNQKKTRGKKGPEFK